MTAAWCAVGLTHTSKIVLLALADNANDAGICWPSIPKIAERCSLDVRSVYRAIATLEGGGHATTQTRPGKATVYRVHPVTGIAGEMHYVYRTEAAAGEFYVGSRTCQGDPNADAYIGSGKWIGEALSRGEALKKTIVSYHDSRKAASDEETRLLAGLIGTAGCMNRRGASTYTPDTESVPLPLTTRHPDTKSPTPDSLSGLPPSPPPSQTLPPSLPPSKNRQESSRRAPARARSRTVPEDFEVTEAMRKWAKETCPDVDIDAQTLIFRDHEYKDPHGNWPAAWRQWMRRAPEFQRNGGTANEAPQLKWRPSADEDEANAPR